MGGWGGGGVVAGSKYTNGKKNAFFLFFFFTWSMYRKMFSSTLYLCARKSPYALHPVSQEFPQLCVWNGSNVRLIDDGPLSSFQGRSHSASYNNTERVQSSRVYPLFQMINHNNYYTYQITVCGMPWGSGTTIKIKRMYLWWSLCALYLLACQVRVTVGDLGLCCCVCVTSFER